MRGWLIVLVPIGLLIWFLLRPDHFQEVANWIRTFVW
jgi:hypothetical protein